MADYGTVVDGWAGAAPHGFLPQVFLLGMLPACAIAGPWLLKIRALASSSLLAPTRKEMAARVGELTESALGRGGRVGRRAAPDRTRPARRRAGPAGRARHEHRLRRAADQGRTRTLALTLLAEARESSGQALAELRDLVRGIHPPVLAERGLDGAVRALALGLPLPGRRRHRAARPRSPRRSSRPPTSPSPRRSPTWPSTAAPNRAWVQLAHTTGGWSADRSATTARGGADPRAGGGLHGHRAAAGGLRRHVAVTSPPGGPTSRDHGAAVRVVIGEDLPSSGTG